MWLYSGTETSGCGKARNFGLNWKQTRRTNLTPFGYLLDCRSRPGAAELNLYAGTSGGSFFTSVPDMAGVWVQRPRLPFGAFSLGDGPANPVSGFPFVKQRRDRIQETFGTTSFFQASRSHSSPDNIREVPLPICCPQIFLDKVVRHHRRGRSEMSPCKGGLHWNSFKGWGVPGEMAAGRCKPDSHQSVELPTWGTAAAAVYQKRPPAELSGPNMSAGLGGVRLMCFFAPGG